MHLTKPTLLLLALTISASCVVATPQPRLLDGLWNVLDQNFLWDVLGQTGLGQNDLTIINGLIGDFKDSLLAIADNLVDILRESILKVLHWIITNFHQMVGSGLRTLRPFKDLLQSKIHFVADIIAQIYDRVKRQALQDALAGLQAINASVSDLEIALQNITDQLEEKKNQYALEIQYKWNNWAAAQLERVDQETNGTGVEEAQEVLNELENRYSGYLYSCLEEQLVRLAMYEKEVHTTVARYQNATNDLVDQIEACQSIAGPISCRIGIKKALSPLQSAPRDLLKLKLKGLKLLAANLDEAGCVGQTLAEHALERPSVERKLDEIIEWNQQNASDSGSSLEKEASSESS
ncbi:hypothetical protein KR032_008585, partial [Drosophila birchii]